MIDLESTHYPFKLHQNVLSGFFYFELCLFTSLCSIIFVSFKIYVKFVQRLMLNLLKGEIMYPY